MAIIVVVVIITLRRHLLCAQCTHSECSQWPARVRARVKLVNMFDRSALILIEGLARRRRRTGKKEENQSLEGTEIAATCAWSRRYYYLSAREVTWNWQTGCTTCAHTQDTMRWRRRRNKLCNNQSINSLKLWRARINQLECVLSTHAHKGNVRREKAI